MSRIQVCFLILSPFPLMLNETTHVAQKAIIGTTIAASGAFASFIASALPFLQFIAAFGSVVVSALTIIHLIRNRNKT